MVERTLRSGLLSTTARPRGDDILREKVEKNCGRWSEDMGGRPAFDTPIPSPSHPEAKPPKSTDTRNLLCKYSDFYRLFQIFAEGIHRSLPTPAILQLQISANKGYSCPDKAKRKLF